MPIGYCDLLHLNEACAILSAKHIAGKLMDVIDSMHNELCNYIIRYDAGVRTYLAILKVTVLDIARLCEAN